MPVAGVVATVLGAAVGYLSTPGLNRRFTTALHPFVTAVVTGTAAGIAAWSTPRALLAGTTFAATVGAIVALVDARLHRIPAAVVNPATLALAGVILAEAAVTHDWSISVRALACGIAGWVLLWLAHKGGGLGFGDVRLAGLLGAAAGSVSWLTAVLTLVAAFVVGGVVALVLLLARRVDAKTRIAFGPALVAGFLLALLLP